MACHNICISNKAPEGIGHLLGLGEKFCPKSTKLNPESIDGTMSCIRNNGVSVSKMVVAFLSSVIMAWCMLYTAIVMVGKAGSFVPGSFVCSPWQMISVCILLAGEWQKSEDCTG